MSFAVSLSRRQVLVLGSATTAVLTAAYAGLRQIGRYPEPSFETAILTPKEFAVLRALGDFLVPPSDELPGSAGDDESLRRIDALLAHLPRHKRQLVRALPHVFEHGPALDRLGARCMTRLPSFRRDAYLRDWAAPGEDWILRQQLWVAVKTLYGMSYFERDDVLAAMGTPIPCPIRRT